MLRFKRSKESCMSKKDFILGLVVGAAIGGLTVAISFKPPHQDSFEIHNLSQGEYPAIRIDKQTGETWGLSDGMWVRLKVTPGVEDPDEWLKRQHYQTTNVSK